MMEGPTTTFLEVEEVGATLEDPRGPHQEVAAPREPTTFTSLVPHTAPRDVTKGNRPYRLERERGGGARGTYLKSFVTLEILTIIVIIFFLILLLLLYFCHSLVFMHLPSCLVVCV